MLKHLDPLLTPDLLWTLAAMGHGDDLALVDANHPAERLARTGAGRRVIHLPGVSMAHVARGVLSVFPLDDFECDPVRRMAVVGDPEAWPDVQREVQAEIQLVAPHAATMPALERFAFYEAATSAFAIVQVGDPRPYGCFLLRKGVIAGGRPSAG